MKPRLRYRFKVWSCRLPDFFETGVIGHGYTPKEAYFDWRLRQWQRRQVRERVYGHQAALAAAGY